MPDDEMTDLVPGEVLDSEDLDAKLVTLKLHGQPHYTGFDMATITEHFGKPMEDLNPPEMMVATAFVYLRRAIGGRATWGQAETQVAIEYDQALGPFEVPSSGT